MQTVIAEDVAPAVVRLASGRKLRRLLVAIFALVVFSLNALLAVFAFRERNQIWSEASQTSLAMAGLVEATVTSRFAIIDKVLSGVDELIRLTPDDQLQRNDEVLGFLRRRTENSPLTRGLTLIDASGKTLYATHLEDPYKTFDMSDRDYFRLHRDGVANGMRVSEAIRSKADNRWVIILSHSLTYPDGRFRGLVTASLDLEELSRLFTQISLPKSMTVTLGSYGRVIARNPGHADAVGVSIAGLPINDEMRARKQGIGELLSPVDHVVRLVAYQRSKDYPLVANVSLVKSEILAEWQGKAIFYGLTGLIGTVLLLGLGHVLFRLLGSLDEEIELRRRHDFIRAMIDGLPGIFYVFDADGHFLLWNQTFEAVSGYSPDEIARMHPRDFFQGADQSRVEQEIQHCFSLGFAAIEADFTAKDKTSKPYFFTGKRFEDGSRRFLIGMGIDISERKRAELEMEEKNLALLRSKTDIESFAHVASHDLREPLRMISAYIALIERRLGKDIDAELIEYLMFAKEGAQRLDQMVLDLLDYADIGRSHDAVVKVDLDAAAKAALGRLQSEIEASGAKVFLSALPAVKASEQDMIRLFEHLLGNAIKFRKSGVVLRIDISAEREGAFWRITVKDNGIGFDPAGDYGKRIFGIFQRLHKRSDFGGGNGIGLAICRRIVEHLGGAIRAMSEGEGKGASFIFTLPAA
jgi:PAS domain S-box-containing protein